jgi:signal transduction histidine kinase
MKALLQKRRLQLQLLSALLAVTCVAASSVLVISDAIRHAQSFVLADTTRALQSAIQDLKRQYRERISSDNSWSSLPVQARDLSLRAISEAVLSSYPGVEGGYWNASNFLGYSYPTHDGGTPKTDVPAAERDTIESVIAQSTARGSAEQVLRGKRDLVVIHAASHDGITVWAMKRLPGQAESAERRRSLLLTVLITAALFGAGGVLATSVRLHRGISEIKRGLATLKTDFGHGLSERKDELGEISRAINEMAAVRRKLEAELRREDRLRTTGRLVASIAHEIRNPLNSIRLCMQLLEQRLDKNTLRREDFRLVMDEVDRMSQLLSDLLAFQQGRPPQMKMQAIYSLLERCVQLTQPQAEKHGVQILLHANEPDVAASIDERQFMQVMMNLILNAVEATIKRGKVLITMQPDSNHVAVEVSDEGPGLTDEQKEHLFEAFYTTKANGIGLGLAVSRELMQSMGGQLYYKSGSAGATFVVEIPK